MADDAGTVVAKMQAAMEAMDLQAMADLLHDDYVQEWPQSGERIRGKANWRAVNENYPGMPSMKVTNIRVGPDFAMAEVTLDYGQGPVYGIFIDEVKDGKVIKETDYFANPFEAPEWRAQWVERM